MPTLKQTLSYLILGQKGGKNRIQIIDLLNERPYNLNQLAENLGVNYRTVKHHIDVLVKNELVGSSKTGGYGDVYFLTPEMESNMALFKNLVNRISNITSTPGFFQNILEQSNLSVVIIDDKGEVLFWNLASEELYGFDEDEVVGNQLPVFSDENSREDLMDLIHEEKQITNFETKLMHKSGEHVDVSLTVDCINDENSCLVGYSLLSRDITGLKREQEALKENAEKYKSVLEGCCPEKVDEVEQPKEVEPSGPLCPVDFGKNGAKKNQDNKGCGCGDN